MARALSIRIRRAAIALVLAIPFAGADAAQAAGIKGEVTLPGGVHIDFPYERQERGATLEVKRFALRYRLSTLWGEPVQVYVPRYELGDRLVLHGRDDVEMTITRAGGIDRPRFAVEPDPVRGSGGILEVSSRDFDRIRLLRYDVRLEFIGNTGGMLDSRVYEATIHVDDAGVLGWTGEWGWDFPGSPSWGEVFVDRRPASLDPKALLAGLAAAQRGGRLLATLKLPGVLADRATSWQVDLSSFEARVRKRLPGAFDALRGYGPLDRQAQALIDGAADRVRDATSPGALDGLRRRTAAADRFFEHFGPRLDRGLLERWQAVRSAPEVLRDLAGRLQDLDRAPLADRATRAAAARLFEDARRTELPLDSGTAEAMRRVAERFASASEPQPTTLYGYAISTATKNQGSVNRAQQVEEELAGRYGRAPVSRTANVTQVRLARSSVFAVTVPMTAEALEGAAAGRGRVKNYLSENQQDALKAWVRRSVPTVEGEAAYCNGLFLERSEAVAEWDRHPAYQEFAVPTGPTLPDPE